MTEPTGRLEVTIEAEASGSVQPGPGQTWKDVPNESRPDEHKDEEHEEN